MNLKIFGAIAIVALAGSFMWNGFTTPILTDEEYIRQYNVLNANDYSDEQILKMRANDEAETIKWKYTNKILDDALKANGIEYKAAQTALLQMQFYDAYYNKGVSAELFLKAKKVIK
jgi:hypothetical protein